MRIDVHTHVLPPEFVQALLDSGRYDVERRGENQLVFKQGNTRFLTVAAEQPTAEQRIEAMDAAGVDVQLLSVSTPSVYFLQDDAAVDLARRMNEYLAAIVQKHPDRFRALASVPLTANIDAAILEYQHALDQLGLSGALLGANIDGNPVDDPRFDPFFEEVNRRDGVLLLHPMIPAGAEALDRYALAPLVGFMFDTTAALTRLVYSNFFGRFLGIKLIAGHLGGALPYLAGRLDMGWQRYPECQEINRPPSEFIDDIYLDTATWSKASLQCALDTVGSEHLLFGSDYPQFATDLADDVSALESELGRRRRGAVMGDTAARLLGIET